MNQVVLVTGSETLTGRKLIEKLLARGVHVVAPVAGRETDTSETGNPNLSVITWNRSSWFSTKAVIRETVRKLGAINAVWLLHQSPSDVPDFAEARSGDIETVLEQSIKGNVALAREILPVLEASGGFLGLVVPHRTGGAQGPLEELSYGAFAGFAGSLIRGCGPPLWSAGFLCNSPDADGFTSNLVRLSEERPGKLRGAGIVMRKVGAPSAVRLTPIQFLEGIIMKTPYRYLLGIGVGLAAGFLLNTTSFMSGIADSAVDLAIRVGRYLLLPLMFFSLPVAVTRLRRMDKLSIVLRRSLLYIAIAGATLTVAGTLLAWLVDFGRIPVIPGNTPDFTVATLKSVLEQAVPLNGFRILTGEPSFVLPLVIPAFLLGWHMYHDREIAEPVFNFFDSFSRILYRANRYFLILMPGMLAVFTAGTVIQARSVVDFNRFFPLLAILFLITLILAGAVFPFVLWMARGRRSPWKTLAALSGAMLGALVSGSPLFNYGNLTRHLKENLKIPRHSAALLAPAYLMFARAGTAMVAAICMLTVIRSYSSLEITLFQAAWTALFSFLVSFALPATPDRGLTASLIILGGLYGRGLDDGWLILAPALPLLAMLTAVLDTTTTALLLLLLNRKVGFEEEDSTVAVRF